MTGVSYSKGVVFMKNTNNTYTSRTIHKTTGSQKAAHKPSRFDRFLNGSAGYMANYAVVKGGLSPFQNGFFVA